ncbi:hypothetical protein Enr13x_30000 [Stieleria neptunia]|uniref:DUF288 domain-containing protein n=1 Tax=Stieleria neptunia TaxID=2527979 RepID=A0A518HQM3_9BACT|nr:STELLO glycosyltransferase family protein [Stieleria neptunia]QDV43146.1 hypothetical protein Enr13x_30000 [Stieleria neptunia]
MLHIVITTIQNPTPSVLRLASFLKNGKAQLVVAGDTKGPAEFDLGGIDGFSDRQLEFLDIESQLNSDFRVAPLLPTKHYCRKNIGYLAAMRSNASCIYETDDDNAPLESWAARQEWIDQPRFVSTPRSERPIWINVYKHFSADLIWPRGLPLDQIREPSVVSDAPSSALNRAARESGKLWAPIQQGLADGAPDVDAIWRLVLDREFEFGSGGQSVMLTPGQWCPFNTQSTWWWPAVYPLLYVPSYCSFRMCDIWKSFVAQRCLWELGTGVVFHASEVVQERNPHNLTRDFQDEIPGYLQNHEFATVLESVDLDCKQTSVGSNLRACYAALIAANIFPEKEMPLIDAWLEDVASAVGSQACR